MKRKLLSLLTLALATMGANAQTTIFSWEGGTEATVSGGTVTANNAGVDCTGEDINVANSVYHVIRLRGAKDYSTNVVVFSLDKALIEGDQIKVTAYRNKNDKNKASGFLAKFDKGGSVTSGTGTEFVNIDASDASEGDNNRGTEPNTITLTVPAAAAGSKTITATRAATSTNLFITKIEIVRTATGVTPNVEFSPASLNVEPGAAVTAPTLSILDDGNKDISDKYTVAFASSNTNVVTVNASTGEIALVGTNEGSATIKATLTSNTDGYNDAKMSYTVTVSSVLAYPYSWDFTTFGTSGTWEMLAADAANWVANGSNTYQSNVAMSGIISAGGVTIPETKFIKFGSFAAKKIYLNKGSLQLNGNKLTISVPDLKAGYVVAVDFQNPSGSESRGLTLGNVNEAAENKLNASTRETRIFTVKEDGDVTLTSTSGVRILGIKVTTEAPAVTISIPASGFATVASEYPIDCANLPSGVKAYKVSSVSASEATLEEVKEAVVGGTGLILEGAEGNYNLPVAYKGTNISASNLLQAAVTATEVAANEVYVLKGGEFCLVTAASTVPAGKAYLQAIDIPAASARPLTIQIGDKATGINKVQGEEIQGSEIYNLQGQRVLAPTKGLYIMNGKKVIVK